MRARVALIVLVACGSKKAADAPPAELAACEQRDAKACFIAGEYYRQKDGDAHLDRAIEMWTRGCELGNGASCGQLGTIVEFGMSGRKSNPAVAMSFYKRGCDGGDKLSCKSLGIAEPLKPIDWTESVADVVGTDKAQLGPAFDGWTFDTPIEPARRTRLDAWEKKFHGNVHVTSSDPTTRGGGPGVTIYFDGNKGFAQAMVARWGKPERGGIWRDPAHHRQVFLGDDGRRAFLGWTPYLSVEELVLPADKDRLGIEPAPLIGLTIDKLQAAFTDRTHVFQDGEADYSYYAYGTGPIEVRLSAPHAMIRRAQLHITTNDPAINTAIIAALTTKWGTPKDTATTLVWKHGARRCTVTKPQPNSGDLDVVLD